MIPLSTAAKESIKTALAVVIAYAIALSLGWEKPFWGAFAVMMISLDTSGQSLNKGLLRMLGTFVAAAVAVMFIALFPQDRWLMVAGVSLWVGFCAYMRAGSRQPYFWFVAAFVCIVIIVDAAPADPLRSYQIAMARLQETAMGIFVYTMVSTFLWNRSSRDDLYAAGGQLAKSQQALLVAYFGMMNGRATETKAIRLQEVQQLKTLDQLVTAAALDSYQVWEVRHHWRQFHTLSMEAMDCLERWRESLAETGSLDLEKLFPNLPAFEAELADRLSHIERMLGGEHPAKRLTPITLRTDEGQRAALSHFEKGALAITEAHLDRLETLSRSLFDCVADIQGFATESTLPREPERQSSGFTIDVDKLGSAARVMATLWVGYLVWIYLDPPGHALFVFMMFHWANACDMLRVSPVTMLPGFLVGIGVAGVAYIFIMPHLSGYFELGLMLFLITAALFYVFWEPRHRMTRTSALAIFHVTLGISNEQTYDFAQYANTSSAMLLSLAFVVLLSYLPRSPRPEKVFLRLLQRFFRHTEFLLSRLALDRDRHKGWAIRWRLALYRKDILELPGKLSVAGAQIDPRILPDATPDKVQALVIALLALAHRLKVLGEERELTHPPLMVEQHKDELRAWRMIVQEQCRLWSEDPAKAMAEGGELERRLAVRVERLEARIGETIRDVSDDSLREQDYENFLRYVGSLRSVSKAGIAFANAAEAIDWPRWREARF